MTAEANPAHWGPLKGRVGTVRVRTTLAAIGVVGLALVVGAVALVTSLRRSLTSDLETALELRAQDVVTALESGTPPEVLALDEGEDRFVQLVDAAGRVTASSRNLAATAPVADVSPGTARRADVEVVEDDGTEEESYLVFADVARTPDGVITVLVGRTRDFVTESTQFVTRMMLIGVPSVILVVGGTAWVLVGRALRPVDAIRDEVEHISERDLDRRVPQPSGNDEIARLATTMNRMLERLEAAQERQRRFVSDASHELRSPLATLRQHAEVSQAHPARGSIEELAEVALAEGARLERLVDDLLLLARTDERRLVMASEPVDLDDIVFEAAERLRSGTSLRIDTSAVSAGRVAGDAGRLRRAVGNLADNAARHAESTVAFGLSVDGAHVVLLVDDDGPGVPPGDRNRVFDRFVRLDSARARDAGGAGLGLSIVAEIVRAHGGVVGVGESPLGGARFEVKLPLRDR